MKAASPNKGKGNAAAGRSRRVLWAILILGLGLLAGVVARSNSRVSSGLQPLQQSAAAGSSGSSGEDTATAAADRAMLDADTGDNGPDERELLDQELSGDSSGSRGGGKSAPALPASDGEEAEDDGEDSERSNDAPAAENSADPAGPSARLPKADEATAGGGAATAAGGDSEADAAKEDADGQQADGDATDGGKQRAAGASASTRQQPSSQHSDEDDEAEMEDASAAGLGGGQAAAVAADTFPAEKMQKLGREADSIRFAAQQAKQGAAAGKKPAAGAQAGPQAGAAGGGGAVPQQPAAQDHLAQLQLKVIEERQLDTGIIHYGDMARVRSFVHKLLNNQPVHIAVVGGSISAGLGDEGFGPEVFRRVAAAFPHPGHRFHNGAVGGVMSTYMNSCLKWHVPPDIDLIMVEFNVNDGFEPEYCAQLPCRIDYGGLNTVLRRGYERLLRKLLMLPRRPAVLMLQTFDYSTNLFMNSGEDQLGVFSQLYSLPWLSFRGTVWKRQQRGVPGYSVPELMLEGGGDKHPRPYGHQMLADLVTGLLRRTGEGLRARPFTPADQAIVDEDLLDPVLPGNIAWDDEYCIIDDKFRDQVSEAPGFEWIDEAKPHHLTRKWGFVATEPGSHLVITLNTAETTQRADVQDPHTVVTINHLKSYEHMGQAEVTCISGCTCQPSIMDGHWEQHSSQLSMHRISVSQAKQCTLKIRVLDATSSGEHKVKVQGLVVSDEASAAGEFALLMPQIIPSDLMGEARLDSN